MGLNLNVRRESFSASEKQDWLGSSHGTQAADSITLDASAFTGTWADGIVPSGVALGKVTASGLYAPYVDANSDGTQVCLGHLFTTVDLTAGGSQAAADTPAALFWHGEVIVANLPASHGLDANGQTDMKGLIKYV